MAVRITGIWIISPKIIFTPVLKIILMALKFMRL